jgi:hypothetical protein
MQLLEDRINCSICLVKYYVSCKIFQKGKNTLHGFTCQKNLILKVHLHDLDNINEVSG